MADDISKKAYISIEREDNTVRYIAKVLDAPPCQITKAQYNAIVKALREQDWAASEEDETSVISRIISRSLQPTEPNKT